MSATVLAAPLVNGTIRDHVHRFNVDQYHEMIRTGILTENDRVELLEGWIVDKMPQYPIHSGTISILDRELTARLPASWIVRVQSPITLSTSEPEPDLVVVKGPEERYLASHPIASDIALVVEVSDSSLEEGRGHKQSIYAAARIPFYWIVNLIEFEVEVFSSPMAGRKPRYRSREDFGVEFGVPLIVDGKELRGIHVGRLFPD